MYNFENRKRKLTGIHYIFFFVIFIIFIPGRIFAQEEDLQRYTFSENHMGTTFTIIVYAPNHELATKSTGAAFNRIAELNQILSDYIDSSEVSRLNNAQAGDTISISNDLYNIIEKSLNYSGKTNGAFDITVGPVVEQWRKSRKEKEIPGKKDIDQLKASVGYRKIELISSRRAVILKEEDMKLDFGGIGKGYAIDQAMQVLNNFGIRKVLIDGGGDILLGDPPPGKEGWRIQMGLFEKENKRFQNIVTLSNQAIASSGDLYQFVEHEGKRYSHIVNPKTGIGLTNQMRVTILAPNGTMADALASAVSVMGVKKGFKLIRKMDKVEGLIFSNKSNNIRYWQTQQFLE